MISSQVELLSDLRLQLNNLHIENTDLKAQVARKCRELKEVKEHITKKYEHIIRQLNAELNEKERLWEREKKTLRETVLELKTKLLTHEAHILRPTTGTKIEDPCGLDECVGSPFKRGGQLQEQVIQLYNQLISLRNVMLEQSRIIEKLTTQKSRAGELRDGDSSSFERQVIPETTPLPCETDLAERSNEYLRQLQITNGSELFTCDTFEMATPAPKRPEFTVVRPRHQSVTVERHINGTAVGSPSSHLQNASMMECSYDKQTGPDVSVNNDLIVSEEQRRPGDKCMEKKCPMCQKSFPFNMMQADFEHHVDVCLGRQSPMDADREEACAIPLRECPVCNSIFHPETSQTDFEEHVDGHF